MRFHVLSKNPIRPLVRRAIPEVPRIVHDSTRGHIGALAGKHAAVSITPGNEGCSRRNVGRGRIDGELLADDADSPFVIGDGKGHGELGGDCDRIAMGWTLLRRCTPVTEGPGTGSDLPT